MAKKTAKTSEKKSSKTTKTQSVDLQVIDYSEKAFAIIGDTKVIKVTLKELGGKYNPKLRCGAGWIFSKKKQDKVTSALGIA